MQSPDIWNTVLTDIYFDLFGIFSEEMGPAASTMVH